MTDTTSGKGAEPLVLRKGKPLILSLSMAFLGGCTLTGSLAKEAVLSLTEREGRERFTLTGELPAHFSIRATAYFSPDNPERCQVYSIGQGEEVTRELITQYTTPYHDHPADFSMDIPLTCHIGLCNGTLRRVALQFIGRYGQQRWQDDAAHGGLAIVDSRPEQAPPFNSDGSLTVRGYCTWLFQISKLQLELSKLLSCSEPDEHWQLDPDFAKRRSVGAVLGRDELAGKTVRLDLRVNPEEEPAMDETWIKFPQGWKPCAEEETPEGTWVWCRNPPTFRTFSMGGKECTVYPNCKE
ncbi:hypothetical protein [Halopseudomonas pertucinogena]|uniref:Lipoprotein n=1 Tax=Halopseudomonas pertucinogena TaxID=86175 RepID=A0ABQ2CQV1_9GAMM|nr:hypothetical protein [Halopseudomonas pertucinogena]GGJ00281.1 lipoprotein [Halopseudomonas pertucinogena]